MNRNKLRTDPEPIDWFSLYSVQFGFGISIRFQLKILVLHHQYTFSNFVFLKYYQYKRMYTNYNL